MLISYINYEYLIFQKGLVSETNIPYLNNFFAWILLFGIPTLITFYLYLEHKKNTKIFLEVRGKKHPATICGLPFYKKSYVKGVN